MSSICVQIEDLLEKQRDGSLSASLRRPLEEHLQACRDCREEAELTEPLLLFQGLTGGEPPATVNAAILGGLRAIKAPPGRRAAVMPWRWTWLEPVPMLATLLLAAVLVVVWGVGGDAPGPTDSPMAGPLLLPAHALSNTVSTVEDIRSPTAEVFALSLPGESGPTEVILIVDRSIDL